MYVCVCGFEKIINHVESLKTRHFKDIIPSIERNIF